LSGIRTHDPSNQPVKTHASDRTATVTGMENTLNILNTQKKGPFLNTLEKFHIYKAKKKKFGNLFNENCTDIYNPIFEQML
jgi:hypothetical protein